MEDVDSESVTHPVDSPQVCIVSSLYLFFICCD
jgi:hypothetical protein